MDIPKNGVIFFDSGIGGLTVLAECRARIPEEIFYYYGDNVHAPYGNLPKDTVQKFVFAAFKKMELLQPKAAVLACNTATALCVDCLRKKYAFPIIGAEPAIFAAAKQGGTVFVLTTRATYESARFQNLCKKTQQIYPNCRLFLQPCDALAGEIERNIQLKNWDVAPFLPTGNPDGVVLGCTHYIYVKEDIAQFYNAKIYDGNVGMANRLQSLLPKTDTFYAENPLNTSAFFDNIFFLGKCKWSNKRIYEQMFGTKTPPNGCRVVKNPKKLKKI